MKDKELQESVIDELDWEPSVDASHIGVTASNGVVTLSGHVPTYWEKRTAERAAQRVEGVKALVEEIEVQLRGEDRVTPRHKIVEVDDERWRHRGRPGQADPGQG